MRSDKAARTRFLDVRGTQVVFMDFSGIDEPATALPVIAHAKAFVAQQPPDSLRTLVDVTGGRFNPQIANALKDLAAHNVPFVIKGAVVGMSGLQRLVYQAVLSFTGRTNLKAFATREEAERWLVAP